MSKTSDRYFGPFDWLKNATIYNHNYEKISSTLFMESGDIIVLYFSMKNVDRNKIIHKFYHIYENARHDNFPIEVINIPMDDNKADMCSSYDQQANWFTLMHGNPLISILQFTYGITAVPHLLVMKPDGSVISSHGILDLEEYGKNALITWVSTCAEPARRVSRVSNMYGDQWRYLHSVNGKAAKPKYQRRYNAPPKQQVNDAAK